MHLSFSKFNVTLPIVLSTIPLKVEYTILSKLSSIMEFIGIFQVSAFSQNYPLLWSLLEFFSQSTIYFWTKENIVYYYSLHSKIHVVVNHCIHANTQL